MPSVLSDWETCTGNTHWSGGILSSCVPSYVHVQRRTKGMFEVLCAADVIFAGCCTERSCIRDEALRFGVLFKLAVA